MDLLDQGGPSDDNGAEMFLLPSDAIDITMVIIAHGIQYSNMLCRL